VARERRRRRLGHLDETDDLVQDVCIKLLRRVRARPDSVKGTSAELHRLIAWAAREVLRDRGPARRGRVHARFETTERLDLQPAGDTSAATIVDRRDRSARLRSTLALLDSEERLAFETVFLQDLSYRLAADRLGWGLGRLRGRMESAFAKMRPALGILEANP
jgi:RNA polymerase sigma factor (sigma-70 family)